MNHNWPNQNKRKNKYNNTKCEADGFKFDSKKERNRYFDLKMLQSGGFISDLQIHPKYKLEHISVGKVLIKSPKRTTLSTYTADFSYLENGQRIIEDVKSPITAKSNYFKLKRGIFEAFYKIELRITY